MYHRQVSRSPRSRAGHHVVERAAVGPAAAQDEVVDVGRHLHARLGRTGPVVAQVRQHAVAQPVDARRAGSPLSKTETSELLASVATNGRAGDDLGSKGSLQSVKGNVVIRSPTRVPPPSLEKTVRPSSASWPPETVEGQLGHHVAHGRGRQDHLVAPGLERDLSSSPSRGGARSPAPSRSKRRRRSIGTPTQADPVPSAVRPTRFTAAVGCACESRTPVELPRYSVATSISAKPASTASRARARPKAPESDESTPSSADGVRLLRRQREVTRRAASADGSTRAKASSAGGAARASASAADDHLRHAVGPDHTGPARRAHRLAGDRDHADRAGPAARRWSWSCSARSGRRRGWSPRPARRTRRPRPRRPRPAPRSTSSWAGITGVPEAAPTTLSAPTPRAC